MYKIIKTSLLILACASMYSTFAQKKPLVVFVCGDHEYGGEQTLPYLAAELSKNYGIETKVLSAYPNQNAEKNIPGLEILEKADLVVFFLRWRQLPNDQLQYIEKYLKAGKPAIGLRTTSHAFNFPKGDASENWNAFGEWAFNAPPGWGGKANHTHYGHKSSTDVRIAPKATKHPIVKGISPDFHSESWLYKVQPDYPSGDSEWILIGKAVNPDKEAIESPVAWIGTNSFGGKIFFTTLGHPADFAIEDFQKLLINAIHWELGLKAPKKWKGKIDIQVPYRGIVK